MSATFFGFFFVLVFSFLADACVEVCVGGAAAR